jgi:hypothetical protein
MARISSTALQEIIIAFQRYENEVEKSKLQESTKRTYLLHSHNFVRWIEGDFIPGGKLR